MVEAELTEELSKLSDYLRKLLDANNDYKSGLLAKTRKEEKEACLGEQQESDIKRTTNEAEARFKEVRDVVQVNLWSRYGQQKLTAAILEAEKCGDVPSNLPVDSTNLEGYEVHLNLLEKRINETTRVMSVWEQ